MVADTWLNAPPPPRVRNADNGSNKREEGKAKMKIPANCTLTLGMLDDGSGTMVMTGNFSLTTQADVEMMTEAMRMIGDTLQQRKPRKKKSTSSPRSTGTAKAA